jgi:hypothetical protein
MAYDSTVQKCGIRSYFVALYAWTMDDDFLEDEGNVRTCLSSLPAECGQNIAIGAMKRACYLDQYPFREQVSGMQDFHDAR